MVTPQLAARSNLLVVCSVVRRIGMEALILTLLSGMILPVLAAEALSEADAVSLIRSAKIVKQEFPLRALISGKEVVVQTRRGPRTSDKDCKIDSVFIAKTLLDAYPQSVSVVKVLFAHEADDKYSEVTVQSTQIADFAAKHITQQKLLDSVPIAAVDPLASSVSDHVQTTNLEPGPFRERRLMMLDRIQSLKAKGTGTKPFEQLFKEAETQIKAGDTAAADATLTILGDTLKTQELQREHLRNFHPVALSSASRSTAVDPKSTSAEVRGTGSGGSGTPDKNSQITVGNGQGGSEPGALNGGPHGGPPGGIEVRPLHATADFELRMRQIEDHRRSQSESMQPALQSALERVRRMLDESRQKDAEVELRRLEHDLGCSNQYWNKLP